MLSLIHIYQVYAKGKKWLAEITNYGDGSNGYAGWPKRAIQGVRAKLTQGHIEIRVHIGGKNGRWLPWVRDGKDYAGLYGKDADGIQMHLVDAPGYVCLLYTSGQGRHVQDYGLRGRARRYYPVQVGHQTAVVPAGRVPVGAPTKLRLRGE